MDPAALHEELAEIVPAVLSHHPGGDARALAAVEAHAAAGCSRCARALVNAGDVAVTLAEGAIGGAVPHQPLGGPGRLGPLTVSDLPRPALRERVLAAARAGGLASRWRPRRFFDPAGEVARLHVGAPGDAERVQAPNALTGGDTSRRYLAQIQGLLSFPLLFVSVVRGERVGYRAEIGFDGGAGDRRRETTFCTHTVSGAAPLVVPNAAAEPFFRGSAMVRRDGVQAYAGVPLRTSRGVIIGTICVMDYVPRRIGPATVRVLELFTEPVAAEIERERRDPWPRTAAGSPLHPEEWFRRLLGVVTATLPLVVASGPGADALADVALEHEPVGRLSRDGAVGLLLASGHQGRDGGPTPPSPVTRLGEIRRALGDADVQLVEPGGRVTNYFP